MIRKTAHVKKFIYEIYFIKFPSYLAGQHQFYEKLLCLNYTRIWNISWSGYGRELTMHQNIRYASETNACSELAIDTLRKYK